MTLLVQQAPLCFASSFILHETCRDSEPRHRGQEGVPLSSAETAGGLELEREGAVVTQKLPEFMAS